MSIRRLFSFVTALAIACGGASQTQGEVVSLPQQQPGSGGTNANGVIPQPSGRDERDAAVPIVGNDPVWGDRNALVTIVEFADFQCPYCSRSAETIAQLQKDYGPHTLRLVYKHSPLSFHQEAKPSAEAAEAVRALAGNAAFWTFYELAFHNQADLGAANYETWARQSGVSLRAFREAMASHRFAAKVDEDNELGKRLGVNGTPAFFINGVMVTGAQPIDKFKSVVDAQIAASKERLTKGVAADELYTAAAKENFKKSADADDDDAAAAAAAKIVWKVPVGTSPQLGATTALVTIVEFSDFQCPFCKRVQPTLQQIKTTYGADVRIIFKQMPLPFHPRAEPSAELALEARAQKGDAGFWAAHDKLFDSSPKLEDADLEQVATDLKLDVAKVKAAIASKKYQRTIDQDQALGDDVSASGTPHFFINGHRLVGAQPFDKFKVVIDAELVKAKALVTAGTKPENVYDELIKNGQTPPPVTPQTIALSGNAPTRGPANARITIVEFSDFQCPFCKHAEDAIADVLKAYPTQVKLQWRHMPLPFHQHAKLAAEASVEAFKQKGNDGFWKLHDALYAHQGDPDGLERPQIEGYAHTIGLDMNKLRTALDSGSDANVVDTDQKAGSGAGVSGTPAFFIGAGTPSGSWSAYSLSGAQPFSKFKKLIDLALGTHP